MILLSAAKIPIPFSPVVIGVFIVYAEVDVPWFFAYIPIAYFVPLSSTVFPTLIGPA